jgi:CubicO group peptidase (beta-lactamase class C family)
VREFIACQRVAGVSAGIVAGGRLAWSGGLGYADQARATRPDQHTLYRIASITKTFTAAAVLKLRDQGRLRLDDPLVAHLPEAATIQNPFGPVSDITLRRLLCHTAGLQGDVPMDDPRAVPSGSIAECVKRLPLVRVVIAPDTQTKYSNLAFQLLGGVIERVSGVAYQRYVQDAFLEPLGMADTAFHPSADRCATGYDARVFSDRLVEARVLDSNDFEADGGLWSSVDDLARWVAFHAGHQSPDILSVSSRAELLRPWIVANDDWAEMQGLGWYWTRHGATRIVGHEGGLDGFSTRIAICPDQGVSVVVLINTVSAPDPLVFELLDRAGEVRGIEPPPPPQPPPAAAVELLGTYREPGLDNPVRIEWRCDRLVMIDGASVVALQPDSRPRSYTIMAGRGVGEPLVFLDDQSGRIDGANIGGYFYQREAGEPSASARDA